MQINTVLKLGSLAFNVAQDDRVRELFTMVHKGAKRRGIIGAMPPMIPLQQNNTGTVSAAGRPPAVPFSPPLPQTVPQVSLNKYLTADNAKKVLGWASDITNLLVK